MPVLVRVPRNLCICHLGFVESEMYALTLVPLRLFPGLFRFLLSGHKT